MTTRRLDFKKKISVPTKYGQYEHAEACLCICARRGGGYCSTRCLQLAELAQLAEVQLFLPNIIAVTIPGYHYGSWDKQESEFYLVTAAATFITSYWIAESRV